MRITRRPWRSRILIGDALAPAGATGRRLGGSLSTLAHATASRLGVDSEGAGGSVRDRTAPRCRNASCALQQQRRKGCAPSAPCVFAVTSGGGSATAATEPRSGLLHR